MKSDAQQGNNGCNYLCSEKHTRVFRHQSMLPESGSACKVLRTEQRIKHRSRQRIKHPSRPRIKHLSRHPFHANSGIACSATYSRLSPFSKWAMRACMHDAKRVETRPFHTHAMWTCMVDVGRVPYHVSCLASWRDDVPPFQARRVGGMQVQASHKDL